MNATASTERDDPRLKAPIANVKQLIAAGADAIGIHLTIGHPKTPEMLSNAGKLIASSHSYGLPVLVASYVYGNEGASKSAVIHAASIARDLGADIVKVMYPGSRDALREVVDAAAPAITVLAGGERSGDEQAYNLAKDATATGAGICFGRSIFETAQPVEVVNKLAHIVHQE
jgi:DhnA family fructose-bisphosphate aldolase class Ia